MRTCPYAVASIFAAQDHDHRHQSNHQQQRWNKDGSVGKGVCAVERGLPWMDTRQDEARQYVAIGYKRGGTRMSISTRDKRVNYSTTWSKTKNDHASSIGVQNIQYSEKNADKTAREGQKVGIT